jgi:hypothetical protein
LSSQLKPHRVWIIAGAFLLGAAALWAIREFEPMDRSFFPKCLLHQWTGLHCPGCGATRALHYLLKGDFQKAVRFNPLLIIGGPIIAVVLWYKTRQERSGGPTMWKTTIALTILVLAYSIARNLPTPTTSPLAPPKMVE